MSPATTIGAPILNNASALATTSTDTSKSRSVKINPHLSHQETKTYTSNKASKSFKQELAKTNIRTHTTHITEATHKTGKVSKADKIDKAQNKNGIDLALKKSSVEAAQQILGVMWNCIFDSIERSQDSGIGEEIFNKELVNQLAKSSESSDLNNMGPIASSIYQDLRKEE